MISTHMNHFKKVQFDTLINHVITKRQEKTAIKRKSCHFQIVSSAKIWQGKENTLKLQATSTESYNKAYNKASCIYLQSIYTM